MTQFAAKQVNRPLSTMTALASVPVTAANTVSVTTALTTALATAGDIGSAVPLQQASTAQQGLITTSGPNIVPVWDATTLQQVEIGGDKLYGRLIFSTPNYFVNFYTNVAGTETAQIVTGTYFLGIPYQFNFDSYPRNSALEWVDYSPGSGDGNGGVTVNETLTVTGNNTISNLAHTPIDPTTALMFVNGQVLRAVTNFTITGNAISFSGGQITANGFNITTTDDVAMRYRY